MTIKDMCETIVKADILQKPDGSSPTSEEIFNYSPTGELLMIWEWYHIATETLKGNNVKPQNKRKTISDNERNCCNCCWFHSHYELNIEQKEKNIGICSHPFSDKNFFNITDIMTCDFLKERDSE